jgi:hypothetical protein
MGWPPDPAGLPRQRRGKTPQMIGRYPDYDCLENSDHWDAPTREVVMARIERVPPIRFFDAREERTLRAFCDCVTAQDREPRIPVLNFIDAKLHDGKLDGFQYDDMPDDREVWRLVARGLDEAAGGSFAALDADAQHDVVARFADAKLSGGVWDGLNVSQAWSVVTRGALSEFYSHPWAWNEIGFGGPAYPRGYSRFGSPHLDSAERETWEGKQAFDLDPVKDVRERGLE